jgi:hypothetical protein
LETLPSYDVIPPVRHEIVVVKLAHYLIAWPTQT